MSCQYQIFASENLLAKTYAGRVTTRCVLQLFDDIENDLQFSDGMLDFSDLRDVTDMAITATDLIHFAGLIEGMGKRARQPKKKAMLAPSGPGRVAAFGLLKLVENSQHIDCAVFETHTDALNFLGIAEHGTFNRSLKLGLTVH